MEASRAARVFVFLLMAAVAVVLFVVDWTPRKSFLRTLDSLEVGMTATEVRRTLANYIEHGSGQNSKDVSLLMFRHSEGRQFGADIGFVYFVEGGLSHVEFSAD